MSFENDDKNVNFMAEIFMSSVFMDVIARFHLQMHFTHELSADLCKRNFPTHSRVQCVARQISLSCFGPSWDFIASWERQKFRINIGWNAKFVLPRKKERKKNNLSVTFSLEFFSFSLVFKLNINVWLWLSARRVHYMSRVTRPTRKTVFSYLIQFSNEIFLLCFRTVQILSRDGLHRVAVWYAERGRSHGLLSKVN